MKTRSSWRVAAAYAAALTTASLAVAAEQTLGTVDQDTYINFDSNGGIGGGVNGGLSFLEVRGGDPFNTLSLTSKSLVRFDLGAEPTIDPTLPYLFEMTTETGGSVRNSNDTFRLYAITDAPTQTFDESTFTWDLADDRVGCGACGAVAPNATANSNNFNDAGQNIGIFFAPDPGQANVAVGVPILGSEIGTFFNGNTFATFGVTSTEINRLRFNSKEHTGAPPRLFTYDAVDSQASGDLTSAGTWQGGAPTAGNWYRVNSGHTVTVAAGVFAGEGVIVDNGTLHLAPGAGANIPLIQINGSGNISHSPGSVEIGDGSLSRNEARFHGGFVINRDLAYTAAAGEDLTINLPVRTRNIFTFNGGAGSDLIMRFPQANRGVIQFNGSGDEVVLSEDEGVGGTLEMNSTGANTLVFDGEDAEQEFGSGTVVFNQPGAVDHRSATNPKSDRLQGVAFLEVNAPLVIDLTAAAVSNTGGNTGNGERLFRVTRALRGAADVTVNGTATAPTGAGITNNSLQIGVNDGSDTNVEAVSYSGTITTSDYGKIEARASLPNARVVINANSELTTGFEEAPELLTEMGHIEINSGGALRVGGQTAELQETPQIVRLVKRGGRTGDLTLSSGANTIMQINQAEGYIPGVGEYDETVFDKIEVEGTATLGGALTIQLNPDIEIAGTNPPPDPTYIPALGDAWDIITAVAAAAPGDFNSDTVVDGEDLTQWQGDFGLNGNSDGDGDNDSDGADFLIWQQGLGASGTAGSITGTFSSLVIDDPFGDLAAANLDLQINYIGNATVQLEVVQAASVGPVPEPTALAMAALALAVGAWGKRRRCG